MKTKLKNSGIITLLKIILWVSNFANRIKEHARTLFITLTVLNGLLKIAIRYVHMGWGKKAIE